MPEKTRQKYFYAYPAAMSELQISRRTLQRWIDALGIEPMEFEGYMRVLLTRPNIDAMQEYKKVLATKDRVMIESYRNAVINDLDDTLQRLRRQLKRK